MRTADRSIRRAALAAVLLAGCAHAPVVAAPEAGPAAEPKAPFATGSLLPQRVDPVTGKVIPAAAVRVYTREDLDRAGRPDLAESLRAARPSQP